ncbi:MAG: hypothetical protein KatS3mg102_2240 [Planctomycetota bacterium]|nr:MAG: hypothetical protein KatS3mg102_2240 [Planctomycetota bacterium]
MRAVGTRRLGVALLGAALLAAVALAQRAGEPSPLQRLVHRAQEQLADRDWGAAAQTLERLLAEAGGSPEAVRAQLLLGKARLGAGDLGGALAAWDELVRRHPDSDYASRARFLMAEAYAAARRHREAALTYRERAAFFTGDAYRAQLAALYLELGDEAFAGTPRGREGDPLDPPRRERDYARALAHYQKAEQIGIAAARRAEIAYRIGLCHAELGQHAEAAARWRRYLEEYPEHERVPAATFHLGRVLLQLGQTAEGRALLARVAERWLDAPEAPLALEALGASYAPAGNPDLEAVRAGVAHWQRLLELFPQHERAPAVALQIAQALHRAGQLEQAVAAYAELEHRYPKSDEAPEARFAMGEALLQGQRYEAAHQAWSEFLARYPNHPRFVQAQRALAQARFQKGEDRFAERRWAEAAAAWREFVAAHPVHELAARASLGIARALLEQDQLEPALAELRRCASRYAERAEAPQAQWLLAETLQRRGRLAEAIGALEELVRRWPRTAEAYRARHELQALQAKELRLRTGHACTTGEPLVLQLTTRNIPELTWKAYRLDLLEYFRSKHELGGVERLATEIVAPDQSWHDPVAGYEPYRLFERAAELPLGGPGAWVVVAEEQDYRAVTLAIRSDLSIICKQAPRQLLVFARNERTGEPWPGVEVLASDGKALLVQGVTGEDGVFRHTFEREPGALRVLAHQGGHLAYSSPAPAAPARTAWGYTTRTYIYTDRPVYRPGDTVHWRGILRKVSEGLYQPSDGLLVELRVRDPRGTLVRQQELRTNRFGSFSGSLVLGEQAPLGTWTISCAFEGVEHQGSFVVEAYRKPEVLVELTPRRTDWLTGETVELEVEASYAFGGPLRAAPLRWWVWRRPYAFDASRYQGLGWLWAQPSGRAHPREPEPGTLLASGEGATDEQGRAAVRFETEPGDDDRLYTIAVEVMDPAQRWSAGAANAFVTARGFYAVVRSDRQVYRPGEPIRLEVFAVDASHRGVRTTGELVLARRRMIAGEPRFEPVRRLVLQTGEDGRAQTELRLEQPGSWRLVFEARDRRGGLVSGAIELELTGPSEELEPAAKLLCERELYRSGETARALVRSPAAPVWALLTVEGESVLDYRVVRLEQRSSTLEIPMRGAYAPNAFIQIAIPARKQLYTAGDEVMVLRYLQVSVEPEPRELRPGGRLRLVLRATDHAGAPVEAELGVAVVDETVFAIRPDTTPAIQPFFYDQRRGLAVGTDSSFAWRYEGVSELRPAALLAELERRRYEAEQASQRARERDALEALRGLAPPGAAAPPAPAEELEKAAAAEDRLGAPEGAAAGAAGERFGGRRQRARNGGRPAEPDAAAQARLRRLFADTAAWVPHLVTGPDGRASLELTLPDDLTRWRVTVRGITRETLAGSAETSLTATQPLLLRLARPRFAVEGDRFELLALAHNLGQAPVAARLGLVPDKLLALEAGALEAELRLEPAAVHRHAVRVRAAGPGRALLRAALQSPAGGDALELPLVVQPFGVREQQARSGTLATGQARLEFTVPAAVVPGSQRLELRLEPSPAAAVLGAISWLEEYPYGCVEQTVNRFLPAVYAERAYRRLGIPDERVRRRLEAAVERGVMRLVQTQNPDGGWGWWPERPSRPETTALALEGLEVARTSGRFVDPRALARGRAAAQAMLRAAGEDHEARAMLLRALALSGRAESEELARALRAGHAISLAAVALLAIACDDAGRPEMAGRALERIRAAVQAGPEGTRWWPGSPERGWHGSAIETTARCVEALLRYEPQHGAIEPAVRWLLAQRRGSAWRSSKDTGAVVAALARYLEQRGRGQADYTAIVRLDGEELARARVRGAGEAEQLGPLVLEAPRLGPGPHTLEIIEEGTGELHYAMLAEWVRRAEAVEPAGNLLALERKLVRWHPPQPLYDAKGRPRTAGYSVLEPRARPGWADEQALERVSSGDKVVVRLRLQARAPVRYLVVEDRLPAGLEPEPEGAGGGFDRYEARDDRAVFFITELSPGTHELSYVARAVVPGSYRTLAAEAYGMYEPEVFARSASAALEVRAGPLAPPPPTPDELYAEVLELLEQRRWAAARPLLERLLGLELREAVRVELLAQAVRLYLELAEPRAAVAAWERLRDHDPRRAEALAAQHQVGLQLLDAHLALQEFTRALELGRQLVLGQFALDLEVAEVYRRLERPLQAQDYLLGLVRRYPETDAVLGSWYEAARRYYELERPLSPGQQPRHYQPAARPRMLLEAVRALREFIAFHPDSRWCDDAQLYVVRALAGMEQWELLAREAAALVRRYPDSAHVEEALYLRTLAHFRAGAYEQALVAGRELLAYQRPDARGRPQPSRHRHEVELLFAQIHHLRGELEQAVEYYRRVADRFADARDSLQFLTERRLELPPLVVGPPGKAVLPVQSKNLEQIELKIYPVDLLLLLSKERDLAQAARVDLTGIAPRQTLALRLPAAPYRLVAAQLELPPLERGAYLVVARAEAEGETLHRSALWILSELELRVQQLGDRMRVYLSWRRDGRPASGALVTVTDRGGLVARGRTDARGIFEAPGARPTASVVAEHEGHLALYRQGLTD